MTTPTPSYTPEQLRGWADNEQRASLAAVLRAHAVALEDLAAAQEALKAARPVSVEDEDGIVRELRNNQCPEFAKSGHAACDQEELCVCYIEERAASHILALKAELASVKAHAEAMAAVIEPAAIPWGNIALEAYRAAHPKDAP